MKKIERFPFYEFHESGYVVSMARGRPRILKPIKMGEYMGLQLKRRDGSSEKQYLHRLIAEAYHGPAPTGFHCRHLDGDKSNNNAKNLAWGTPSQNNLDKNRHGTGISGESNPMAKLTAKAVEMMRRDRDETGDSYAKIAKRFNVSTMTAFRAITGKSWNEQAN